MKEKKYAFKFRVCQVRIGEAVEDGDPDISKHQLVNLKLNPMYQASVKLPGGPPQATSPDFLSPTTLTPRGTGGSSRNLNYATMRDKERPN